VQAEVDRSLADPSRPYQVQHRIIRPDNNEIRWMHEHGAVYADVLGKPVRMAGIVRDITEKRGLELLQARTERLFRTTLDNLYLIALHLDEEGRVLYVNPYMHEVSCWRADELMGKNFVELCIPEDAREGVRGVLRTFAEGNSQLARHYSNPILCKGGQLMNIFWNNTPVFDEEGKPIGIIAIGKVDAPPPCGEVACGNKEGRTTS
jgi:PAS domain S-box-containing protein